MKQLENKNWRLNEMFDFIHKNNVGLESKNLSIESRIGKLGEKMFVVFRNDKGIGRINVDEAPEIIESTQYWIDSLFQKAFIQDETYPEPFGIERDTLWGFPNKEEWS